MMHAKCVIIDEDLALSGSANLDARSLFLNYELMVAFMPAPTCGALRCSSKNTGRQRSATKSASRDWRAT